MKVNELRKLSDKDLVKMIQESKKELFDLWLKQSTGNLDKPSKVRELRKDVARMNTILNERKMEVGGDK